MFSTADIEKFWNNVDKNDGCWTWKGALYKHRYNYGHIEINGKAYRAHRVAYELTFGSIPTGLCVLHSCDNPSCVNPSHLWIGTQVDNLRDMCNKGRARHGHLYGEAHPSKRPKFRKRMTGENNPAKRPEVRKKISEKLKGRPKPRLRK